MTPFLLARLAEETGGRTLAANRALVVSNAAVAARIAVGPRPWRHAPVTAAAGEVRSVAAAPPCASW